MVWFAAVALTAREDAILPPVKPLQFVGLLTYFYVFFGFAQQRDKLLFIAQPIVGRAHEPADPVCSLSGWLNGIGSDKTVGKGLAPSVCASRGGRWFVS